MRSGSIRTRCARQSCEAQTCKKLEMLQWARMKTVQLLRVKEVAEGEAAEKSRSYRTLSLKKIRAHMANGRTLYAVSLDSYCTEHDCIQML